MMYNSIIMKNPAAAWTKLILLSTGLGLILLHCFAWQRDGVYARILAWNNTEWAYLAIAYNLALILLLSLVIGSLMQSINDLRSHRNSTENTQVGNAAK
ncbi:hypothetical protein ACFLYV_05195 [Chloroflexota bacterium]